MDKHLFQLKFLKDGPKGQIYAPIGVDVNNTLVFSYRDINLMEHEDWMGLLNYLNQKSKEPAVDTKTKERIDERIRYIKNMMKAIGYNMDETTGNHKPPFEPLDQLNVADLIISDPDALSRAALRFIESSDTNKKKVAKFVKSYKAHSESRKTRNLEILTEAIMIQHPWMLLTQPTMELIILRQKIVNLKSQDPTLKKVIETIDNEMTFRKRVIPSIQEIDNSCDLVALKESRDQLTKYLAGAIGYFSNPEYTKQVMNDKTLAPYHLMAGRLLKHTNAAIEKIHERIRELSLASNDTRYTIQVNACIDRLNVYYEQLKSYFEDKPGKRYSVELAYIMPTIKSIRDTLSNMHELYVWYENRLGKDKSKFTLPTCPKLENISEKRVQKIGKMSFPELYLAYQESKEKHDVQMFSDIKIALSNDMEYIKRVIRERLKYIQDNDDAVPKQSVKFITEYTEMVVKALNPIHGYMSRIYDKINKLLPYDLNESKKELQNNSTKLESATKYVNFKESETYNKLKERIQTSDQLIGKLMEIAQYNPDEPQLDDDLKNLLLSMSMTLRVAATIPLASSVISPESKNSTKRELDAKLDANFDAI
jgi:DNA-binding ferritin-like protein